MEQEFHEAVASKIEFPSTDGLEVIKLLTQINEMNAQIDHVQKQNQRLEHLQEAAERHDAIKTFLERDIK